MEAEAAMKSIYTKMRFKLMNSGWENWSLGNRGRERGDGEKPALERCGFSLLLMGLGMVLLEDKGPVLKTCTEPKFGMQGTRTACTGCLPP